MDIIVIRIIKVKEVIIMVVMEVVVDPVVMVMLINLEVELIVVVVEEAEKVQEEYGEAVEVVYLDLGVVIMVVVEEAEDTLLHINMEDMVDTMAVEVVVQAMKYL